MSRAFRRSSPNLHNSEYIRNKKSKVMYNHMVNVAVNNKCSSSDGKTKIDCSGYLLHTNNQETLNLLRYGSALCAPCDISGLVTEPGDISGVLDKCGSGDFCAGFAKIWYRTRLFLFTLESV